MTPQVSVLVRTRNHEKYIEQALRSALMQRTTFEFEIVVGENASTDGTAAVVRRVQEEHPGRIRATFRPENIGLHRNFIETYRDCRAPYIAYLDGDDYWLTPDKLQKQIDFLERRPECSLCFTNAYIWTPDGGQTTELMFDDADGRTEFAVEDLVVRNFLPMCAIVARNGLIDEFPSWFAEIVSADDWVVNLLMCRRGGIGYLPGVAAVYRRHPGGAWSGASAQARCDVFLKIYDRMPELLGPQPHALALARALAESIRLWQANQWLQEQTAWFKQQADNYRGELERTLPLSEERQAWVAELERAREWLTGQVENYRAEAERAVRAFEQERARGGELGGELDRLRRDLEEARGGLAREQQEARATQAWLQGEIGGYREALDSSRQALARLQREVDECRRSLASLQNELDESRAAALRVWDKKEDYRRRLERIERSRGWRLVRLARRLVKGLWRNPLRRVRGLLLPERPGPKE
jgi:hypothetical protein